MGSLALCTASPTRRASTLSSRYATATRACPPTISFGNSYWKRSGMGALSPAMDTPSCGSLTRGLHPSTSLVPESLRKTRCSESSIALRQSFHPSSRSKARSKTRGRMWTPFQERCSTILASRSSIITPYYSAFPAHSVCRHSLLLIAPSGLQSPAQSPSAPIG